MARLWEKLGIRSAGGRRVIASCLAIAGCLVVAGCTALPGEQSSGSGENPPPPATSGPAPAQSGVPGGALVIGGGITDVCADGTEGGAFTFGVPVTNRSDETVHLVSAQFEHIGGAELVGMWIVGPEVDDDDTQASVSWSADYPPAASDEPGWPDRTAVGDASISAHSTTWLAFALQLPADTPTGTVAALSLDYQYSAGTETATDQGTYGIGQRDGGELSCAA